MPLFDQRNEIIGTQIFFKLRNEKRCPRIYSLKNFRDHDWQHENKYCRFGYKVYNKEIEDCDMSYLFEIQLKQEVQDDDFFTDYDKNQIFTS